MMAQRAIPISTDLYAAIWSARKPGEESEEDILRRILGVPFPNAASSPAIPPKIGFRDPRYGIELPEEFEFFGALPGGRVPSQGC